MKKLFSLVLALSMALALTACSGSADTDSTTAAASVFVVILFWASHPRCRVLMQLHLLFTGAGNNRSGMRFDYSHSD